MKRSSLVLTALTAGVLSCSPKPQLPVLSSADSLAIVQDNIAYRLAKEEFFRTDPGSPFRRDTTIVFDALKWFPVDTRARVASVLHRYEDPETVAVMGTRGEERRHLRYGYFSFVLPDETGEPVSLRLNVYKFTPYDGQRYELFKNALSVWFTDQTTGTESYPVGRYLDVGIELPDPSAAYTIDFNKAYNPYCAYSHLYSCAVPRDDDYLDLPIRAGERPYHD